MTTTPVAGTPWWAGADWVGQVYKLAGPVPDKNAPDVWRAYTAAMAVGYQVLLEPGLVMRLGRYGRYEALMIMFANKYHQRFALATNESVALHSMADLLWWLEENPVTPNIQARSPLVHWEFEA